MPPPSPVTPDKYKHLRPTTVDQRSSPLVSFVGVVESIASDTGNLQFTRQTIDNFAYLSLFQPLPTAGTFVDINIVSTTFCNNTAGGLGGLVVRVIAYYSNWPLDKRTLGQLIFIFIFLSINNLFFFPSIHDPL